MTSVAGVTTVSAYLARFAPLYPDIEEWYAKVLTELPQGGRSIHALCDGTVVRGLAIVKHGRSAKLCHISLDHVAREKGLGHLLIERSVNEAVARGATSIYVTTGDDVALQYGGFFARYAFSVCGATKNRYRRGVDELQWRASCAAVLQRFTSQERHVGSGEATLLKATAALPVRWAGSTALVSAHPLSSRHEVDEFRCPQISRRIWSQLPVSVIRTHDGTLPSARAPDRDENAWSPSTSHCWSRRGQMLLAPLKALLQGEGNPRGVTIPVVSTDADPARAIVPGTQRHLAGRALAGKPLCRLRLLVFSAGAAFASVHSRL
jgi:hypothetical protein